ncbi:MAG TPA: 16S rRNA (uracil(1498)-N(3))-methyltransferase [Ideonella sp.]|nr:16S rRNA (uracil(1498)-N(3))-methyltransferase [Ideonella sp.]
MPARLYVDAPLAEGAELNLPPDAARHAQVLRLQPGYPLVLFNGLGGEWLAEVTRMGRQEVALRVGAHSAAARELPSRVRLAVGMPANERMDALIEKATELGAAAVQPLQCARSVLRLAGERADKRRAHWQAVAVAASEQSGRTEVPTVEPVATLAAWLGSLDTASPAGRYLLSFAADAVPLRELDAAPAALTLLSGPEGGLDESEEALARARGFVPLSLGPRVLRADTAPLAALAWIAARC